MSGKPAFARTPIKSTRQKCPLETGMLWVCVIDKNSKQRLLNAAVTASGPRTLRGHLPKGGVCRFVDLPAGTYDVTASARGLKGYQNSTASTVKVTIVGGDFVSATIEVDVDEAVVVLLVDHEGLPVADEACSVTVPSGVSLSNPLTPFGSKSVRSIRLGGDCKISLPQLDNEIWEFVQTTSGTVVPPAAGAAVTPVAVTLASPYTVLPGDCLHSIAYRAGMSSKRIWSDARNANLRKSRKDPAVLLPGDSIAIPAKRADKVESRATSSTHKFRRTDTAREYRFQVLLGETPRDDIGFDVTVDGEPVNAKRTGTWVTFPVRPDAKDAVVTLTVVQGQVRSATLVDKREYRIKLGYLRPVETPEGQEDRLRDLGYYASWPHAVAPALKDVIQLFQATHGISPADGNARASTVDKLKKLAGDPA